MSLFITLLLLLIFSILEVTLIPLNLVLALVIIISLRTKTLLGMTSAFAGGIFYDVISGQLIGLSSLMMLLISGFLIYLKEKFSLKNPLLRLIISFFIYLFYQGAMVGILQFKEAAVMAVVMMLLTQSKEEAVKL
jgi:rod shape-determining protein MreD